MLSWFVYGIQTKYNKTSYSEHPFHALRLRSTGQQAARTDMDSRTHNAAVLLRDTTERLGSVSGASLWLQQCCGSESDRVLLLSAARNYCC